MLRIPTLLTVVSFIVIVSIAFPGARAANRNLNYDNAPAIARLMEMTLDEFRAVLGDREKPLADYIPGSDTNCGLYDPHFGQKDGRFYVWGEWARKGNKNGAPFDFQYRPGTGLPLAWNPLHCFTNVALRTAPPEKFQPFPTTAGRPPARRIDLQVRGSVNSHQAKPEVIRQDMAQSAKRAAESKDSASFYTYLYVPDLGFGLDRNDLFAYRPKPNSPSGMCQVIIKLADSRKALSMQVQLFCHYQATSNQRAITMAKNAAAIMANKVFGANAKLDRDKGEVGILDAYLASRLGETPQEDVRENKFKLGDTIYLAVVYRATQPGMRVRVSGHMRPGPDALVASEARAPLIRPGVMSKWHSPTPLQPDKLYHRFSTWINSSGQVDEDNSDHTEFLDATVSVKPLTADTQVFYIALTTGQTDNLEKFFLGIGRWDIALSMSEYRGKEAAFETRYSKESLEVSTEKISLIMDDNPVVARRYLTDLPKKP